MPSFVASSFNVWCIGKCDTFGEEIKLSRKRHMTGEPDEYTSGYGVKALSYCDLHVITLSDLMAVLDDYPEFADDFLRQFVVTFSIQREVRLVGYVGGTNCLTGLSSELHTATDHNGPQRTPKWSVVCLLSIPWSLTGWHCTERYCMSGQFVSFSTLQLRDVRQEGFLQLEMLCKKQQDRASDVYFS